MEDCLICGNEKKDGIRICKMCGMKFTDGVKYSGHVFCSASCRNFFMEISAKSPVMAGRSIVL